MTPEQIASVVEGIRERVRSRYQKTMPSIPDFVLPPLERLGQAREEAEGKAASIGIVNPRRSGPVNLVIQSAKKLIARLLYWHVREQVPFNRASVQFMNRTLETLAEQNSNLLRLAHGLAELQQENEKLRRDNAALRTEMDELTRQGSELSQQTADAVQHWNQWHPAWEEKVTQAEIHFLEMVREIEGNARKVEAALRQEYSRMHEDYRGVVSRSTEEVQSTFWTDMGKLRKELEHLIHTELRLIRRRTAPPPQPAAAVPAVAPVSSTAAEGRAGMLGTNGAGRVTDTLDYARFEERFRGTEDYIAKNQQFYVPYFRTCRQVLDLGCGRGEFLKLLTDEGVPALGVDADPDAVAACTEKSLRVERADLFEYLSRQPDASFDGIFCVQVVEHLSPRQVPELISLASEKLEPGGVLVVETPNPRCLAIFAGDFYIDPTHVRPVPSGLLSFYFEEAGMGSVEIHELHPAADLFPEVAALDRVDGLRDFRRKFFGGLDYALVGRKLRT